MVYLVGNIINCKYKNRERDRKGNLEIVVNQHPDGANASSKQTQHHLNLHNKGVADFLFSFLVRQLNQRQNKPIQNSRSQGHQKPNNIFPARFVRRPVTARMHSQNAGSYRQQKHGVYGIRSELLPH